ncbi:NAD(P)-binding domain-containing protein [Methanobacterium sp. ACI-7]|uniref:NAD(P)-binding domain-containing protein n=1 Tax=unclassified Methanobacterium TaxID=2627676 RepID=UPI0039C2AA32
MKVGFIGFGEVASTLSKGILENGIDVVTCIEGRSSKTRKLAREIEINLCKSNREVAETSDILFSAVTPASAIRTAQEVGKYVRGIYVDINNISPATAKKALSFIKNGKTVDASIIGAVRKGLNVPIIASGPCTHELTQLNEYGMNITVVGSEIGQASAVKMLRSSFTKGISALLFETLYAAYNMGINEEVLKYIAETECKGFKDAAVSRVISSAYHAKRRHEEMGEVIELLSESENPKMSKAAEEFFKMIYSELGELDKRPENYTEIFKQIKEKKGLKDYQ